MNNEKKIAGLYIRGNATTTVANIPDHHFIRRRTPRSSSMNMPNGFLGPRSIRSKYPTTVGGRTSGKVKNTSSIPFIIFGNLAT